MYIYISIIIISYNIQYNTIQNNVPHSTNKMLETDDTAIGVVADMMVTTLLAAAGRRRQLVDDGGNDRAVLVTTKAAAVEVVAIASVNVSGDSRRAIMLLLFLMI